MSWLHLEGAVNVRDVGGLPTVDGRTTRSGVLLRADNLQDLTEADVELLVAQRGLRTVVDLRSSGEVHLTGDGPLKARDVRHVHLSLIPEWDGEPDAAEVERVLDELTQHAALPPLPARPRQTDPTDLAGNYTGYVRDAGANIGAALTVLADPASGLSLVHCAAGKDRTGVVVALALSLVGVTREAVVADYLRSAERADEILARLKGTAAYGPGLEGVTAAQTAPVASSMEGFLDAVDRDYGGPHGLAMSLGVGEETVARLGARLVGTSPRAR
ncbi:MAG: protein tyrosine/serine phosphatase [Frankiales bacterium]|nr:protein tyrosine/serine phosphatase [Frankiales bacterium]